MIYLAIYEFSTGEKIEANFIGGKLDKKVVYISTTGEFFLFELFDAKNK